MTDLTTTFTTNPTPASLATNRTTKNNNNYNNNDNNSNITTSSNIITSFTNLTFYNIFQHFLIVIRKNC